MKFRSFGWGIVCIVALSLVTFSGQIKPTDPPQVQKEVISGVAADNIRLSPGINKNWHGLATLGKQILEDSQALKSYFSGKQFDKMTALFHQRRGVISGKDYELMYGKDSLKFWNSVYSDGATLEIKVAMVYVSNVTGPHPLLPIPEEKVVKPTIPGKTFDAAAFVVVEFHVIKKTKEGAVLRNDSFPGELGYRHQWLCQWDI